MEMFIFSDTPYPTPPVSPSSTASDEMGPAEGFKYRANENRGNNQSHFNYPAGEVIYPSPFRTVKKAPFPGVCKLWLDDACPMSPEDCPFDHKGQVDKEMKKCKYYALKNNCAKAKACSHMHENFPCRAFHLLGEFACPNSHPCRLSHEPLDEVTGPLFHEVRALCTRLHRIE